MKLNTRNNSMIDVGQMRNVITLLVPTITAGTRNNQIVTYPVQNQISAYARVDPGKGARSLQEANLTYNNVITVYFRYLSSFQNNWKIKYDGEDYTINPNGTNIDAVNRFIKVVAYTKTL